MGVADEHVGAPSTTKRSHKMSEKKAKEKRKEGSKLVVNIGITLDAAKQVVVSGLPDNPFHGMGILTTALQAACRKYNEVAQENINKNVIPFKTPLLGPDGKKVN